jgi:hypothetical protein
MTEERREAENKRHRIANTSDEYRVAQIERHLISNMSQENRDAENERHRLANMTDEQNLSHRERNAAGNLSLDQLQRLAQDDALRQMKFKPMGQDWDYANPCANCKAVWLTSDSSSNRKACCKEGNWKVYGNGDAPSSPCGFPALRPIPRVQKDILTNKTFFFTSQSAYYNNLFSIGITEYYIYNTKTKTINNRISLDQNNK